MEKTCSQPMLHPRQLDGAFSINNIHVIIYVKKYQRNKCLIFVRIKTHTYMIT